MDCGAIAGSLIYGFVQTFGAALRGFEDDPGMQPAARYAFYLGVALPVCGPWVLATWAGAVAGRAIPDWLALDFAVPITFIALVAPALRDGWEDSILAALPPSPLQ